MNDIKLIVTDMDGTFLNSNHEVSPEFPEIYKELKKRNILFVPASGRQMAAITKYFPEIGSEIGFIAENGAYVIFKGEEIYVDSFQPGFLKEIIEEIRKIPKAKAVVSAKNFAYIETDDSEFRDFFGKFYAHNKKVEDLTTEVVGSIFKIAVFHPEGSEKNLLPFLKIFKNYDFEVVVSGDFWLDIMNKKTSKGKALAEMQNVLNISHAETMVFGDYMNDIEMMKLAKYSYAMENAHPDVKEIANFETSSNDDFGVLEIIKQLFKN